MDKELIKNSIGWGAALWFLGFSFSMIFFPFVPVKYIGIPVLVLLLPATYIAAIKILKEKEKSLSYVLSVAFSWLLVAVVLDYAFLVKTFDIQNYYDLDVLIYYIATLIIPFLVWKNLKK